MARILFTAPPLTGHLNPALAVAAVLRAQGHRIAWAVHRAVSDCLPPGDGAYFLDDHSDIKGATTTTASAAAAVRGAATMRLFFADYAVPMADRAVASLTAAARAFAPSVVVVDQQMLAGALVARKLDIPWVTLATTSAAIVPLAPPFDAWVAAQYQALQQRHLPAAKIVAHPDFSPWRVIVFSVEALLDPARARVPANYAFVGVAGGARAPVAFPWDWLRPDRPLLLVTLGTVSRDRDTRFFDVIMAAVAELDVQAVLVAPAELAARAPANVLVRDFVPQWELLDRVAGVICHAGHNSVCEALAKGVPLIVAPIRDDQPVIARQVVEAGAGLFMRQGKVTVAAARAAIQRMLTDAALKARAGKLAAAFAASSGAVGAATIIAELAAERPRP